MTIAGRSGWMVVENPASAGKDRSKLKPACHDRSRFLTIGCDCGGLMHLHETQLPRQLSDEVDIATRCHRCGAPLYLEVGALRRALREAWS